MTIADRIKQEREKLNLSQEELAKACGYADKTSISKVENSGDNITLKKIQKIAKALGVTHRYLMGWESSTISSYNDDARAVIVDISGEPNPVEPYSPEEVRKAIDLYKRYSHAIPEIQSAVESLLKPQRHDP